MPYIHYMYIIYVHYSDLFFSPPPLKIFFITHKLFSYIFFSAFKHVDARRLLQLPYTVAVSAGSQIRTLPHLPRCHCRSFPSHRPANLAPSPYNQAPARKLAPSVCGRKRAVICGVLYKNTQHELKGCVNDAKCIKYLLVKKFRFPESSILMLNGHGSQQKNYSGDEVDGYDKTLCPLDFETQGMIVDDEINAAIVRSLPAGVKLHAIIDACHSGTVLDLSFLCRMGRCGRYAWEDHRPQSGAWKGTNGGEVISFSACDDNQNSADTSALSRITSTGVMTYCFIQAIERGQATTYGNMLNSTRSTIRKAGNLGGASGLRQEPHLTANEKFDVYKKTFSL